MRPLEILIPVLLAVWLVWGLLPQGRPRWVNALPGITLVLTSLHLALEGYRWQMIPIYLLVVLCCLFSFRELRLQITDEPANQIKRTAGSLLGLASLIVAVTLAVLLPVPKLPAPTGPYQVGSMDLYLVDETRREIYAPEPGGPRELMVQIWYPAEGNPTGEVRPWMEDMEIMGPAISRQIGMPPFFAGHVEYALTNSLNGAPVSADGAPYPVLLFSHGWGGFRQQNTFQMEELASHGYVVAAVQHPYGAVATIFPDGRLVYNNPQALPVGAPEAELTIAARRLVDQWAGDLGFALDYMASQNEAGSGGPFSGRLDLERVGVLGHSTGGGATVEFCGRDARCRAALGLDAYLKPVSEAVMEAGLQQASLFLYSEQWPSERTNRLLAELITHADGPTQAYTILGTAHYDFSDLPMLSPLAPYIGLKGPLNGERALRIINDYSLAFFNAYLKGEPSELLEGENEDYPEVIRKLSE